MHCILEDTGVYYSQSLSGVPVRHEPDIVFGYYRMDSHHIVSELV